MGTANVTAGSPGRVRITFNDWVENKSDIRGTLWLAAHMKAGTPQGDQTLSVIDLNTHFSSDLNISAFTDGELTDENIAKWGVKTDHNTVLWKVRLNTLVLRSTMSILLTLLRTPQPMFLGSFRIYRVMMDSKGNVLPTPGWVKITDSTTKPVIAEDGHSSHGTCLHFHLTRITCTGLSMRLLSQTTLITQLRSLQPSVPAQAHGLT